MEETAAADVEALKEELLSESKRYCYPTTKKEIRQRYRNAAYELHKRFEKFEFRPNFLSFGSRRSSTLSNYGNTPIVMRRSVSSNGELAATQAYHFGSLRGVPAHLTEEETKYSAQFGSLRGLPTNKRLSKFDEMEEESAAAAALVGVHKANGSHDELIEKFSDDKSERSWDAASIDQGTSVSRAKGKSRGLFRRKKDEPEKHKDKWRGSRDELKGDLSTKSSPLHEVHREIQKSSESLVSVKRKKPWWFRRKKSKEGVLLIEREDEKTNEIDVIENEDRVNLSEKAVSDNNLKMQNNEDKDNASLHEELRKSQILLKGYSQRNVAGLSLSKRLSGASQSVTSRGSLSGSDVMISDSSKCFMQYELPRIKDPAYTALANKNTVADLIREGQTYEEKFETSLGSDCRMTGTSFLPESAGSATQGDDEMRLRLEPMCGAYQGPPLPAETRLGADTKHTDLALEELESLDRMLGELQGTHVDEAQVQIQDKQREVELRQKPEPLSPDSRPIRPLHFSAPVKSAASPSHIRPNVGKTASLPGQESYPHSLMDRPITSRFAKRLSSEMEAKDLTSDQSDLSKKSNIAYTLTFDKELICVNLRTKSAPGGPNAPIAVSADPSAVPKVPYSSVKTQSSDLGGDEVGSFERQYSGGEDRETSPGYRLAYPKSGMRSPTPPRRSLRKNPKVTREKDRLAACSNLQSESQSEQDIAKDSQVVHTSPYLEKEHSLRDKKVSVTQIVNDESEEQVVRIEVKSGIVETPTSSFETPMVTGKFPMTEETLGLEFPSDAKKSTIGENFVAFEGADITERRVYEASLATHESGGTDEKHESEDDSAGTEDTNNERPAPKLQRRNTFTLSSGSIKTASEHANGISENHDNHQLNGDKDHSNHTNGDVSSVTLPKSPTPAKSPLSETVSLLKSPAHVSTGSPNLSGNKTRIPVRRGGTSESAGKPRTASKIPMMSAGVPERSSLRAKRGGAAARGSSNIPPASAAGLRGIPIRKPSLADGGAAAAKIGAVTSPLTDNFMKIENNTIVVKRETFMQIVPEATSSICSLM